jgi:hypothetical protein
VSSYTDTGEESDLLNRSSKADSVDQVTMAVGQQSEAKIVPVPVFTSSSRRSISNNKSRTSTWSQGVISVCHGKVKVYASDITVHGIDLPKCRPINDFRCGFYTTRLFNQAAMFAN